ncbi:MAG: cell division protein ZapB [Spirochaetaceae bacterium]|nr:cell division protein ZapB [Spirochaetaceae bacterium]
MITLDQVQLLEKKVETIVSKINDLQRQNSALQEKNRELIEKNSLLMQKISTFEADQNRIEQGILNALDRLNSMENSVLKVGTSAINESQNVQPQEQQTSEVVNENSPENNFQENNLTDFSNISDSEQNTGLDFSDEDINESNENDNSTEEQSLDFGLNLDFDSSTQEQENDSQNQLGIF